MLGNWLHGFDNPAASYVHLSWHLALFRIGTGPVRASAGARYERDIRPSVVANSMPTLADSASFLWRVQMYSGATSAIAPAPLPWEEVRALAAPMAGRRGLPSRWRMRHSPSLPVRTRRAHDDVEHLQRSARQGDLFIREMVVPLVQGIGDFTQGE